MIQTYTAPILIPLLPDPVTTFTRGLVNPCIFIDTINKRIEVTWHMHHTTPTGVLYFTTTHRQVADNTTLVNLTTQERISIEQYEALSIEAPASIQDDFMGEYDYWHLANKSSPFPIMDQVEAFGEVFAQRNGWL
jgi:hypothetical protein